LKPIPALTIIENYLGGPEQANDNDDWRNLSDTVVTYSATKDVSLALNYDYARDTILGNKVSWQGIAAYLKYQANPWFAVTPRFEWFDDKDGFATSTVQKVKEFTLTAELKHKDGVMLRIEYRGDFSDVPYFIKKSNEAVKKQNTLLFGFVYAFTTKAQ
jgi:hypothetical protein